MNDMSLMQVVQALDRLLQNVLNNILTVGLVQSLDIGSQSVIHQLNKDPKSRLEIVSFDHFKDALILLAHAHHTDLIDDDLALLFVLGLHEFQSANETILLALNFEDLCEAALTQFANDIVEFARVSRKYICVFIKRPQEFGFPRALVRTLDEVTVGRSRVVHGYQNINNVDCVFVNIFLTKVEQIRVQLIGQTNKLGLALLLGHKGHLVDLVVGHVSDVVADIFLLGDLERSLHLLFLGGLVLRFCLFDSFPVRSVNVVKELVPTDDSARLLVCFY